MSKESRIAGFISPFQHNKHYMGACSLFNSDSYSISIKFVKKKGYNCTLFDCSIQLFAFFLYLKKIKIIQLSSTWFLVLYTIFTLNPSNRDFHDWFPFSTLTFFNKIHKTTFKLPPLSFHKNKIYLQNQNEINFWDTT